MCREYPKIDSYLPPSCGFFFGGGGIREGRCLEECDASCCKLPRRNGEPGEGALPEVAGGLPCRHLVEVDEKVSFSSGEPVVAEGTPSDQPDDIRDEE